MNDRLQQVLKDEKSWRCNEICCEKQAMCVVGRVDLTQRGTADKTWDGSGTLNELVRMCLGRKITRS